MASDTPTRVAQVPAAVIIAYGHPEQLGECLAELDGVSEIIIVDNSSLAEVRDLATHHRARYLDPGRNVGFAAGVNLALEQLPAGRDVLLLNPDAVVSSDVVRALSAALHARPRVAA